MEHTARKYLGGGVVGFLAGALVIHPLSMVVQGLVYPDFVVDPLQVFNAFSARHLPMAAFFGVLGTVVALGVEFIAGKLSMARRRIVVLEEILPICSYCKKIRDDGDAQAGEGAWVEVDTYLALHRNTLFSHGICPDCYGREVEKMPGTTGTPGS